MTREHGDRSRPDPDPMVGLGSSEPDGREQRSLKTLPPGELVERLEALRRGLYTAKRCQEEDVRVNGPDHPGLLEPMRDILRELCVKADATLPEAASTIRRLEGEVEAWKANYDRATRLHAATCRELKAARQALSTPPGLGS